MTLLRTKIKREAKVIVKKTKKIVKKVAKKLSGKPKTIKRKKNPILKGETSFKKLLSKSDKDTKDLIYDLYESYEVGNEQRGIDYVKLSRIIKMIEDGINNYDFDDAIILSRFANKLENFPKNTIVYLPHTE